jgi:hypothetical protein
MNSPQYLGPETLAKIIAANEGISFEEALEGIQKRSEARPERLETETETDPDLTGAATVGDELWDKVSPGTEYHQAAIKAYKSPDGKVLRFMIGPEGPFDQKAPGAMFGWSLGDDVPDWC